jgi:hypothetical protein
MARHGLIRMLRIRFRPDRTILAENLGKGLIKFSETSTTQAMSFGNFGTIAFRLKGEGLPIKDSALLGKKLFALWVHGLKLTKNIDRWKI